MRLKDGFGLRDVCGEKILVPEGTVNIDFSRIINLNETAALLWEKLVDKNFEVEDIVDILCAEYDVPTDVALNDCNELAKKWIEAGLAEE
jgi:hypothetical protein